MIQRLLTLYYPLRQRPHGQLVIVSGLGAAVAVALLIGGLIDQRLWMLAVAFSLTGVLGGIVLLVALGSRLRARLNDVHDAISLDAGLRRAGWHLTEFFTDAAAANPSLQLFNLKVLQICRPASILELGSGQTTKLLSAYARDVPEAYVLTLEQDEEWIQRLGPHVVHEYRHSPLVTREFNCQGSNRRLTTQWYGDVPELRARRFDYILVDGPDPGTRGFEHTDYARCGLLEHMPAILATSFVVVFDDAERYGETMTVQALREILDASSVPYVSFAIYGLKTQVVFCSRDRAYLQSI